MLTCKFRANSKTGQIIIKTNVVFASVIGRPLTLEEAVLEARRNPAKWGETPSVALENNSIVFVTRTTSKDSKRFNIFSIVDEYNEKYLRAFIIRKITTESGETPCIY